MTATNATAFAAPLAMSHVAPGGRRPVWEPLLYIFTRGHLFIEASHRTSFRIFDNSLLRDIFPENYKKTTILLYMSSCAVETVPATTRVMKLQLCMTKIYSKVSNAMEK